MCEPTTSHRATRSLAILLVSVAVGGSLWYGAVMRTQLPRLQADPDAYRRLAKNLAQSGVYGLNQDGAVIPTAYRPPLYPAILSLLAHDGRLPAARVATLHVGIMVASLLLMVVVARQWGLTRWAPLAAIALAVDPILLNQSQLVMTEPLAALLAIALLGLLGTRQDDLPMPRALAAGLVLGLAILCRPVFLPFGLLAAAIESVRIVSRRAWSQALPRLVLLAAAAVVLTPWCLRNAYYFGQPIATTTHGGYTLLLGNNRAYYDYLRSGRKEAWRADELGHLVERQRQAIRTGQPSDELIMDRWANDQAKQAIRDEPQMFIFASLVRLGDFWRPLPQQVSAAERPLTRAARYAVAVWYLLVYAAALGGIGALGRKLLAPPWRWGLVLVVAFLGVHWVYWSNMRMRGPVMPLVYLLAVAGIAAAARGRALGAGRGHQPSPAAAQ